MAHGIVSFKLTGFEQLYSELDEFPRKVQKKALRAACFAGAEIVKKEAKMKVYRAPKPYWSKAKEIIGVKVKGKRGKWKLGIQNLNAKELEGVPITSGNNMIRQRFNPGWVGKNIWIGRAKKRPLLTEIYRVFLGDAAWFGRFIEYGGHGLNAQPFIRPALWNNIDNVLAAMRDALNKFIAYEYAKATNNILRIYIGKGL